MDSQDGELFVKHLAAFVRTHEKSLANVFQSQHQRRHGARHGASQSVVTLPTFTRGPSNLGARPPTASSTAAFASAVSMTSLNLSPQALRSARLELTPHHLFYLLSRFEDLGIAVGPMTIRLENLHDSATSANYVSFLSQTQRSKRQASDVGSIRSVSSIKSVMSGMSSLWASFGLGSGSSAAAAEKHKLAIEMDVKSLYSAFTKLPCLRLAPDWRARMIKGYEEFPFDSAVPLHVFKNVQALEVCDIDFRQFYGWDRMADQLRSLTLRRAKIDDPADVLIDIVFDDIDKRRRRMSKSHPQQISPWPGSSSPRRSVTFATVPTQKRFSADMIGSRYGQSASSERSTGRSSENTESSRAEGRDGDHPPPVPPKSSRNRSYSPRRPSISRSGQSHGRTPKIQRSGSGSSQSDHSDMWPSRRGSTHNILATALPPASKWRLLRHLSLADNGLTVMPATSLSPLATTLHSFDLSCNLFTQIPDSLAKLTALRALNLSSCMIDSLRSLTRNPLPAITAINLRANRLDSIAGIERLYPLERLDLRDNRINDPIELARLTGLPDIREVWVEGNPFTRTHHNYRVTIFNLFRNTPGYTQDIIIDATGPSYAERKLLVERIAELPSVPVVQPVVEEAAAIDVSKPAIIYADSDQLTLSEGRMSKAAASEVNTSSSRRRAAKRRIVDLADSNSGFFVPVRSTSGNATTPAPPEQSPTQPPTIHQDLLPLSREDGPAASALRATTDPAADVPRIDLANIPQLQVGRSTEPSNTWQLSPSWSANGEGFSLSPSLADATSSPMYTPALAGAKWDSAQTSPYAESPFFRHAASPLGSTVSHAMSPMQAIHSGGSVA